MDIFCDGFDHYATADFLKKWDAVGGTPAISSTGGRRGGGYCSYNKSTLSKSLDGTTTTYVVGVAINDQSYNGTDPFIQFTKVGNVSAQVGLNGTGQIYITNGTTTWTSTTIVSTLAWHYIEFKVKFVSSIALGDVEVKVDGTVALTVPAAANFTNVPDLFGIGSISGAFNNFAIFTDDMLLQIASTSYLGDVIIEALKPAADGSYTDLTPTGATNRYACVNEAAPNGDTTYISSGTAADRESFTYPALSKTPDTIIGIQHLICARKTGTADRSVTPFLVQGGTNRDSSAQLLTADYKYARKTYTTSPATGVAFTATEITNLEAGVIVV